MEIFGIVFLGVGVLFIAFLLFTCIKKTIQFCGSEVSVELKNTLMKVLLRLCCVNINSPRSNYWNIYRRNNLDFENRNTLVPLFTMSSLIDDFSRHRWDRSLSSRAPPTPSNSPHSFASPNRCYEISSNTAPSAPALDISASPPSYEEVRINILPSIPPNQHAFALEDAPPSYEEIQLDVNSLVPPNQNLPTFQNILPSYDEAMRI